MSESVLVKSFAVLDADIDGADVIEGIFFSLIKSPLLVIPPSINSSIRLNSARSTKIHHA